MWDMRLQLSGIVPNIKTDNRESTGNKYMRKSQSDFKSFNISEPLVIERSLPEVFYNIILENI